MSGSLTTSYKDGYDWCVILPQTTVSFPGNFIIQPPTSLSPCTCRPCSRYHEVGTFANNAGSKRPHCPPSSLLFVQKTNTCKDHSSRGQLLRQANVLFERPIKKIVYCYGQWQECFKDMARHVQFVEGIPENIPCLFPPACRPGVLVLDDLIRHCSDDERILDLFTSLSPL